MNVFHCDHCEQLVFFENTVCVKCGNTLAYLPDLADMGSLNPAGECLWRSPLPSAEGRLYRLCDNYTRYNVCNWVVRDNDPNALCQSCRLTRVIPDLDRPGNKESWYKLEVAKRRLVYSLLALGCPVESMLEQPESGLAFEFLADSDTEGKPPVLTGHADGVITLNIAEANDVERERRRIQHHEPYRTLLGHFRHEVGHYYWDRLIRNGPLIGAFRERFGDERRTMPRRSSSTMIRDRPRLAEEVRQCVRQRPPLGRLGRDLGPLLAHDRYAGNRGRLRPDLAAQA